jgi:hypothetical protein
MASAGTPQCSVCGAASRAGARFCGECGNPVLGPPPSIKGNEAGGSARGKGRTTAHGLPPVATPIPEPGRPRSRRRPEARNADPDAPTDPALVLGLGPAGAPLPPVDLPPRAPEPDDDEDDRPTQTRRAAGAPPPPVVPTPSKKKGSGEERTEFQRLLEEVENGFDSILLDEGAPSAAAQASTDFDASEVQRLFEQIAVAHARPVRDFMVEIKLGEPPKAWIAFCRPAVKALERSARGMELKDLAGALEAFASALDLAEEKSATALVRDEARQLVIDAYSDLIARMPQAFALESESNRREAVIVHALLAQVAGLHEVGMDRLYETGMTSLALYYVSRPGDLVESARLDPAVAQRVVERFAAYRKEVLELVPDDGRALELGRVEALCDILERTAASYEEASASWSAGSATWRKELRRTRADAVAQLRLLMARLGELDLLTTVEALPTAGKVAALRAFVEEARRGWKPPLESGHKASG